MGQQLISKKSPNESPLLIVWQKPEASDQTNATHGNEHLQEKICGLTGKMCGATLQLPHQDDDDSFVVCLVSFLVFLLNFVLFWGRLVSRAEGGCEGTGR